MKQIFVIALFLSMFEPLASMENQWQALVSVSALRNNTDNVNSAIKHSSIDQFIMRNMRSRDFENFANTLFVQPQYQLLLHSSAVQSLFITKIKNLNSEINHALAVLRQCAQIGNLNRCYIHDFINCTISYSALNNQLIAIKEQMAPILFTAHGTPRSLDAYDCQQLLTLFKKFEKAIVGCNTVDAPSFIQEITNRSIVYAPFADKQLEQVLRNNRTTQNIEKFITACDKGNFTGASSFIKPYNCTEIVLEHTSANNKFLRSYYKESFDTHYTEVGLDKHYVNDPYFHNVNVSLLKNRYEKQDENGVWHIKPIAERIKEQIRQPHTIPHAVNNELAWRKNMYDVLLKQLNIQENFQTLDRFLYGYISCIRPADVRLSNWYLAQLSIDHPDHNLQKVHFVLSDEFGINRLIPINTSSLEISAIPQRISLHQYSAERECLFNLLALKPDTLTLQNIVHQGFSYVQAACSADDAHLAKAYRVMAQNCVHACYDAKNNIVAQCENFAKIPQEGRALSLHHKAMPFIAAIMQRLHDPRIALSSKEQEKLTRTIMAFHDSYTKAIFEHNMYEHNICLGYLNGVNHDALLLADSGIYIPDCVHDNLTILDNIEVHSVFEIQDLVNRYMQPFMTVDTKALTEKIYDQHELQLLQHMCTDETLGSRMYSSWQEADHKCQTLVPQYLENLKAHEMMSYLDGLQTRFARDQESYLLKACSMRGAVSNRVNYIVRCFEKANIIGALELLKKGIAIEQIVLHPLEAARNLVDGTGLLLRFTGKCLVAYGHSICIPSHLMQYREQYRQEIESVIKALWHVPLYEKYKIAVNLISDVYLPSLFINTLSKVKPFLQSTSNRLLITIRNTLNHTQENAVIKKLFSTAQNEIKAIESLGAVRDTQLLSLNSPRSSVEKSIETASMKIAEISQKNKVGIDVLSEMDSNLAHNIVNYEKLKIDLKIGEFTSVVKCTKHGVERLIERGFSVSEVLSLIKNPDYIKIQLDGAKVFIKKFGETYSVVVINETTEQVVTALRGINYNKLIKLANSYGWEI